RTLAHEIAHLLGYGHPDGPHASLSAVYANTVPAFIGCVAMSYPDLAFIGSECSRADDAERPPSPFAWSYDLTSTLAAMAPEALVSVLVDDAWLDARVVAIDREHGKIEIGLAIAGLLPS